MKKMKKWMSLLLCALLVSTMFTACGGNGNGASGNNGNGGKAGEGEVEIMWWTSYATVNTNYIQDMINEFNELHEGEYHVEILYSGENNALRTKLSTTQTKDLPALITGQPIVTPYYASHDAIKPIQDFIDADEEDWTANVYDVVKSVYADADGRIIGWPMGVSAAGWFVNTDMVEAAGYTVGDLTSYEKIAEVATAIKNKGLAEYGLAYSTTGMVAYDGLTLEGVQYVDNNNGYDGAATKSVLGEKENKTAIVKMLDIFKQLQSDGVAYTYGANTDSDVMPSFISETIAMMGATNSYTNKILEYNPTFEFAYIPNTAITENGKYKDSVMCEGTGTFIVDNGNEKVMQGAYELLKFLAQPENQSYWCTRTGYIPYTEEAFADADYQTWMKKNLPEAELLQSKLKNAETVAHGPYTELPESIQGVGSALFSYLSDDLTLDYEQLIADRIRDLDEAIEIDALRK